MTFPIHHVRPYCAYIIYRKLLFVTLNRPDFVIQHFLLNASFPSIYDHHYCNIITYENTYWSTYKPWLQRLLLRIPCLFSVHVSDIWISVQSSMYIHKPEKKKLMFLFAKITNCGTKSLVFNNGLSSYQSDFNNMLIKFHQQIYRWLLPGVT